MNGKLLSDGAAEVARQRGYLVAHFNAATVRYGKTITSYSYDAKGWPDLLLVGRKVVAVEVKGDGDTIKPEQKAWLAAFERAGVETLILTPRAWLNKELEEILDRKPLQVGLP